MKIKLDQVKPSPEPVRTSWDEEEMDGLAQSIKEQKQVVPIKVRRTSDGQYEVVYGNRRLEACRRAGLTEIEAIVEDLDDTEVLIQALIENVQREDMNSLDKAKALKAIQDRTGWSMREMERQGIMGRGRICDLLALLDEPPWVIELTAGGGVTVEHVTRTRRAKTTPEEREKIIKKAAVEELTVKQTRRLAEAVVSAPNEQAKEALLKCSYSRVVHNPDRIKQKGEDNPLFKKEKADEPWKEIPEVVLMVDSIKDWHDLLKDIRATMYPNDLPGKARHYLHRRVRKLIEDLLGYESWLKGFQPLWGPWSAFDDEDLS